MGGFYFDCRQARGFTRSPGFECFLNKRVRSILFQLCFPNLKNLSLVGQMFGFMGGVIVANCLFPCTVAIFKGCKEFSRIGNVGFWIETGLQ